MKQLYFYHLVHFYNELLKKLYFYYQHLINFYRNQRPIKTASDTQARRKIYKSSVDSWKNYEKNLGEVFKRLPN